MALSGKIKARRFINRTTLLLLFTLAVHSFSANAQENSIRKTGLDPESQAGNGDKYIHLASNLNMEARAVPLHGPVNSPYAELKPTLSPDGTRLYFSRAHH